MFFHLPNFFELMAFEWVLYNAWILVETFEKIIVSANYSKLKQMFYGKPAMYFHFYFDTAFLTFLQFDFLLGPDRSRIGSQPRAKEVLKSSKIIDFWNLKKDKRKPV